MAGRVKFEGGTKCESGRSIYGPARLIRGSGGRRDEFRLLTKEAREEDNPFGNARCSIPTRAEIKQNFC